MLKVLIVDDEILIRVGVKSCLDWEENGFEVVGLAEDGIKALNLIAEAAPDIILTDIKMPNMDGLELIKVLRRDYPQIKVIVLSCYNELDYVKQAMKLGAEDYLLKLSVQPETLLEIMNRMKTTIKQQREEELKTIQAEKTISLNRQILKDNHYKKLLNGFCSTEEFLQALKQLDVKLVFDRYWVVCCRTNDQQSKKSFGQQPLRDYSFCNIVLEVLADLCQCDIAEIDQGYFVLMITNNKDLDLTTVCQKVGATVNKYLNTLVSFGISQGETCIGKLREQYRQARCALEYMFYDGWGSIAQFEEKYCFSEAPVFTDIRIENQLLSEIESLNFDQARLLVEALITELSRHKMYSPEAIKYLFIEVIYAFNSLIRKHDLQGRFIDFDVKDKISTILTIETLEDLKTWFKQCIQQLVAAYPRADSKGSVRRLRKSRHIFFRISKNRLHWMRRRS